MKLIFVGILPAFLPDQAVLQQSCAVSCVHPNCSGLGNFISEGMNERKLPWVVLGEVYNDQALNRLPGEVAESPSTEVFKKCAGMSVRHILVGVLAVLGLQVNKLSPGSF